MDKNDPSKKCAFTHEAADVVAAASPVSLAWTFEIPADVANRGVEIAIYGQDPKTSGWLYWSPSTSTYIPFSTTAKGPNEDCLINATPSKGSYTADTTFDVNLPTTRQLQSGVVVMFIGGSSGIPVTSGVPASPTTTTNPNDLYSLFEFTYSIPKNSSTGDAILDIDISNVDQVGFTYTVTSSSAPFPLAEVGSSVPQQTVFNKFSAAFPEGTPFNECLIYGKETVGGTATQLRILAPQDVLEEVAIPDPPSYLNPTCAPTKVERFANNTYFYMASESSATGETATKPTGVFGGFLLSPSGDPQALGIDIGWQSQGTPAAYVPVNPTATGINLYRALAPATNAGSPPPPPPTSGYTLRKSMTIDDWNKRPGFVLFDDSTSQGTQTPRSSSYGFSALSTWFDQPLQDFFNHYVSKTFSLHQFNQNNQPPGTMWTGKVVAVTPKTGQPITALKYIDERGQSQSVSATWQWGDGTNTYKVLQLVGNAYDEKNLAATPQAGQTGLTEGEFQGAVVNVYFPYFAGNTGLASFPQAPSWMLDSNNGPSQMVFGCSGVFATPNDPDAIAQESSYPVLAGNALTNIQNVIVSAFNRGIATGHGFGIEPLQYTCLFGFSQAPEATSQAGAIPSGTYTYFLSGTLNGDEETVLSWGQSITLTQASTVTLVWKPQLPALYKQANVYRQTGAGPIQRVGTITNSSSSQATTFTDANQPVTQPTSGAPFVFYPAWDSPSNSSYAPSNLFSAFLHQNLSADPTSGISINGLVYGYPFDDQGNFSTNINYGSTIPSSVSFRISSLT